MDEHNTEYMVVPELEHLIELMTTAIEQQDEIKSTAQIEPKFVAERFTWKAVVDQLLDVLIGDESAVV